MRRGTFSGNNNERPRNPDRVQWATSVVTRFAKDTGLGDDLRADPETVLADLLADLLHWCDAQKTNRRLEGDISFESALGRALGHYREEVANEVSGLIEDSQTP
jgi:hypothetical protein